MPELLFIVFDNLYGTTAYGNLRSTCKELFNFTQTYQGAPFVQSVVSKNLHRKTDLLCTAVKNGFFEIVVDILSNTHLSPDAIEDACIVSIANNQPHILAYLLAAQPAVVSNTTSPLFELSILQDCVESFAIVKERVLPTNETIVWKLLDRAAPNILDNQLRSVQATHLERIIVDACLLAQKGKAGKLQTLSDALCRVSPLHQDTVLKTLEQASPICSQLCFGLLVDKHAIRRGTHQVLGKRVKYTCYVVPLVRKATQYSIEPKRMCDAWLNWDARSFDVLYRSVHERHDHVWRTHLLNVVVQYDSMRRAKTFINELIAQHTRFLPDALVKIATRTTQTSTIETMLKNGADATWGNNTPLHMACRGLYAEPAKVFDLLVANGATVPDTQWRSWLNDAINACRVDVVKRLIAGRTHEEVQIDIAAHLMSERNSKKTKIALLRLWARM